MSRKNNLKLRCLTVVRAAGLESKKKVGNEILFHCPNHNDEHPSLTVNDKKNLWMCGPCAKGGTAWKLAAFLADCGPSDKGNVIAWLIEHGLMEARPDQRDLEATYVYEDEHGEPLLRVERYRTPKGKTFRQSSPDGNGGWIPRVKGVQLVPYRLPDFINKPTVYIVEGEADADALWEWGIPATTNPMGAGKWKPDYNPYFEGKQVVLLPDHDAVGESHMQDVLRHLLPGAKQINIVLLPNLSEKQDFSDWKRNGGTLWQLSEIVRNTPPLTLEEVEEFSAASKVGTPLLPSSDGQNSSSIAEILTKSEFDELDDKSTADDIDSVLRSISLNLHGVDPLKRAGVSAAAVKKLKDLHVESAGQLIRAALRVNDKQEDDGESKGKGVVPTDPDLWPDPVNGSELLDEITNWVSGYVSARRESVEAMAVWAVSTWFVESTYFAPILCILSPTKQTGKTLIIDLLEWICRKPVRTSGIGITPAVIFRLNEQSQPTFLVDEAEKLSGKNADESIIGLLNVGYRRGGKVHRCGDKSTQFKVEEFDAFGFRLLVSIRPLWDTILDRSIVIRMTRKPRNQDMRRFKAQEVQAEGSVLARKILRFSNDHIKDFQDLQNNTPRPKWLSDRGCDNWSPLFAVAHLAGDDWLKRALDSAKSLSDTAEEGDRAEKLIHDIYRIFKEGSWPEVIKSGDLVENLNKIESSPWGDYKKGKGLTPHKISAMLRPFGIKPEQHRDRNGKTVRGYWLKDLKETFERYIPSSEVVQVVQPNNDGAFSDSQSGTGNEPCTTSKTPETRATTELSHLYHSGRGDKEEKTEKAPEQHVEVDL